MIDGFSADKLDDRWTAMERQMEANTIALLKIGELIASIHRNQKIMMATLILLVVMHGALFAAMAKGFHWF